MLNYAVDNMKQWIKRDVGWCLAGDGCSLWKSYVTLFWSLFGLTQLGSVREGQIQNFTKRVAEYMLMCYHAMACIVLVNMLIAMMSNSFQEIEVTDPSSLTNANYSLFLSIVAERLRPASRPQRLLTNKSIYLYVNQPKLYAVMHCVRCRRSQILTNRKSEQTLSNSLRTLIPNAAAKLCVQTKTCCCWLKIKLWTVCLTYRLDISFTTLFWTLFGLITLVVLEIELRYVEGFGKLLFGLYNIAARILFLNMLIAMMSKSFNVTVVSQADSLVYL